MLRELLCRNQSPPPSPSEFLRVSAVISEKLGPKDVAKKTVHHLDFPTLLEVNKEVVALTGESHEYSPADGKKLEELVAEVEGRADNMDFEEAIPDKASYLVFKIASGQYFKAGNKRTALVAGLTFLRKNGYKVDLRNTHLISSVDKVGVAAATLDDLQTVIQDLIAKAPAERKGWDNAVKAVVESNSRLLRDLGS